MATHYLSANAVRDALSDFSVFKRFDAQATYIHAIANSNTGIANEALPYFTDFISEVISKGKIMYNFS